jgi:aspartate-semialdehyde dehydrogenase
MARIPVSIVGATGTVGQKFVRLLADHPWFEITAISASEQSAGKRYGDVVRWREPSAIPPAIADMVVRKTDATLPGRVAFSAVDDSVAHEIEQGLAKAGAFVVTNTKTHRMEKDVPLVIPEINAHHLDLIPTQQFERGWSGGIVANPNCSTAGLALALAPLHLAFGIEKLFVSTMQAVSGAGYPGVASLDALGNVIPYIGGEEEKIERESRKILDGAFTVSAHTNRVPVVDGHMETVSVGFSRRVRPEEAISAINSFIAPEEVAALPSSPARPVEYDPRPDRPQSRLDIDRGGGMTVTVGRVRPCNLFDIRLVLLSHNTIRGAAGAAVQNAELLVQRGLLR